MSTPRRSRPVIAALAVVVAPVALAACTGSSSAPGEQVAKAFLADVGNDRPAQAAASTDDPTAAKAVLTASQTGLGPAARATFHITAASTKGDHTAITYTATWRIVAGVPAWTYTHHLTVDKNGSTWRVHWTPAVLAPALTAGTHLASRREQAPRAALLDRSGTPLVRPTAVVTVGIEPKLVHDLKALARELAAVPALQSSAGEIESAVRQAADPTDFVPVITLRRPAYEAIRDRIHSLPGTVFQTGTELLGPTPGFGQPLLGRVGPATAAIVSSSHGRVVAGDVTGIGGLEQALDSTLSGTPGEQVGAVDDTTGAMKVLATLSRPKAGRAVRLTLDEHIQQAAEQALASVGKPAAVVAVQPSTGRILADADSAAVTYDIGLQGAFPAGSTFKIATWTAAFTHEASLTPSTLVPCPSTTTVDGRVFINENRFSHPPISVSASFGYSCNTSAIQQAVRLPAQAVGDAARSLGIGATWKLPVPAFSGTVPTPSGLTEQAADGIGQGKVLVSPLAMAAMAGAAATGHVRAPQLEESVTPTASRPDLPARIVRDMTALMNATVHMPGGTAGSLASFSGLIGKTGTAEYGNATPPRTHTWFVGVRGDLAFAVFVYDGATGGGSALPVVSRFLDAVG